MYKTDIHIEHITTPGRIGPTSHFKHISFYKIIDETNEMACAPREDSDLPGHPPSLIRVFAVRFMDS